MRKVQNIFEAESLITRDEKAFERLVHIIAYIISIDAKDLSLTRLLKYLYIIDEISIKSIGIPVTHLEYKVAENGPLADLLRTSFINGASSLKKYFKVQKSTFFINIFRSNEKCHVTSLIDKPNLNLLSRFEVRIIKETVEKYKGIPTEKIIDELHEKGTLWHNIVSKHKIEFQNSVLKVTDHKINFEELISNDEINSESFRNYKAFQA